MSSAIEVEKKRWGKRERATAFQQAEAIHVTFVQATKSEENTLS